MRYTRRPMDAKLACAYVVTYPTKCERFGATFPRSALGGAHATIRTNECLGMGHRLPHRLIRYAEADTQIHSVCMRWDVSLFCSARCCGGSEGIEATWCSSRVSRGRGPHRPGSAEDNLRMAHRGHSSTGSSVTELPLYGVLRSLALGHSEKSAYGCVLGPVDVVARDDLCVRECVPRMTSQTRDRVRG
jgi:hypothetical protein